LFRIYWFDHMSCAKNSKFRQRYYLLKYVLKWEYMLPVLLIRSERIPPSWWYLKDGLHSLAKGPS
jgi:hypothetical protein